MTNRVNLNARDDRSILQRTIDNTKRLDTALGIPAAQAAFPQFTFFRDFSVTAGVPYLEIKLFHQAVVINETLSPSDSIVISTDLLKSEVAPQFALTVAAHLHALHCVPEQPLDSETHAESVRADMKRLLPPSWKCKAGRYTIGTQNDPSWTYGWNVQLYPDHAEGIIELSVGCVNLRDLYALVAFIAANLDTVY